MPLVSVVIDTYNQAWFVEEAVESVLQQTIDKRYFELLVVDDGSTDDTKARIAGYGKSIHYLRKWNEGQASALNLGFQESRGDIVAFLDADDRWLPHKLEAIVQTFEVDNEIGMVYHPAVHIDSGGQPARWGPVEFHNVSGWIPQSLTGLLRFNGSSTSCLAFRRSALAALMPVPQRLRIMADGFLNYLCVFVAPVAAIDHPLTEYRLHGGNLFNFSGTNLERAALRYECQGVLIEEMKAWLRSRGLVDDERVTKYLTRFQLSCRWFGFQLKAPGRVELVKALRAERDLYRFAWSRYYGSYRVLQELLAWLLGYRWFMQARGVYWHARLGAVRRLFFPTESEQCIRA